jgi:hypothetical protein
MNMLGVPKYTVNSCSEENISEEEYWSDFEDF